MFLEIKYLLKFIKELELQQKNMQGKRYLNLFKERDLWNDFNSYFVNIYYQYKVLYHLFNCYIVLFIDLYLFHL